jgi:hypothetical protein
VYELYCVDPGFIYIDVEVRPLRIYLWIKALRSSFSVVMKVAVVDLIEVFAEICKRNVENSIISTDCGPFQELQLLVFLYTLPKVPVLVACSSFPALLLLFCPRVP